MVCGCSGLWNHVSSAEDVPCSAGMSSAPEHGCWPGVVVMFSWGQGSETVGGREDGGMWGLGLIWGLGVLGCAFAFSGAVPCTAGVLTLDARARLPIQRLEPKA